MKRAGNLYEKIAEPENLALAFWKAQRGKRACVDVFAYRENLSENLSLLRSELLAESVPVGNYHYFKIYDPKERVICAADFRERGLPIGNLTSQFFANMYLGALDHYIKEKLHVRSYVRYMDDFVLFSKTKRELRAWRAGRGLFVETIVAFVERRDI